MVSKSQMDFLLKSPRAMMEYHVLGRLPRGKRPDSPLIRLLETLTPRERIAIEGIRISNLGYSTGHEFRNAEQLYRWLKPANEVFWAYPAINVQNARFAVRLSLSDLLTFARRYPDWVRERGGS